MSTTPAATSVADKSAAADAAAVAVEPADIDRLTGPVWRGTLTYLDYTSGTPTEIPSGLRVTRSKTGEGRSWDFAMSYDDEPRANNAAVFALAADGREMDGAKVISRTVEADGAVRIVTEEEGEDDRKPARIRHVLRIGDHEASWQKLVKYAGGEFIERNVYRWKR